MRVRFSFLFWLGIVLLCCAGIFLFVFPSESISTPPSTLALGNAKSLALACSLYAGDHKGKLPAKLHDLVPVYFHEEDYAKFLFRDFSGDNIRRKIWWLGIKLRDTDEEYIKRPVQEWDYYGVNASNLPLNTILIASPAPSAIHGQRVRVVIYADQSGAVIPEEEFQHEMKAQR